MSRHRNVRSMNYQDEYDGYDDVYGHSVEESDLCVSPNTASQFMYDRSDAQLASFLNDHDKIPEEDESEASVGDDSSLQDSSSFTKPQLTDLQEAQLNSCLEQMHSILGDSTPEHILIEIIIKADFDYEKALNSVLTQQDAPKPQRAQREPRNRDLEDLDSYRSSPFSQPNMDSVESVGVLGRSKVKGVDAVRGEGTKTSAQNKASEGERKILASKGKNADVNDNTTGSLSSTSRPISLAGVAMSHQNSPRSPFSPKGASPKPKFNFGTPPNSMLAMRRSSAGAGSSSPSSTSFHPSSSSPRTTSLAALAQSHHPSSSSSLSSSPASSNPSSPHPHHISRSSPTTVRKTAFKTNIPGMVKLDTQTNTGKQSQPKSQTGSGFGAGGLAALAKHHEKSLTSKTQTETGTKERKPFTLSSLSHKEKSSVDNSSGQSKTVNLSSLALAYKSTGQNKGTKEVKAKPDREFSLANLAKHHSNKLGSTPPRNIPEISLASLAVQHGKQADTSAPDVPSLATSFSSMSVEKEEKKSSGFTPQVTLAEEMSEFGSVLCSAFVNTSDSSQQRIIAHPQFAYNNQFRFQIFSPVPVITPRYIEPFDFTTPSPDETVLEKQKRAFKPSGGRGEAAAAAAASTNAPMLPPRHVQETFPTVVMPAAGPAPVTIRAPAAPSAAVSAPIAISSPGVSDRVARLTFTSGSRVASGFQPQPTNAAEAEAAAAQQVKRDLSDRLGGVGGDKQNGDSTDVMSTPKRGRLDGGEEGATPATPKSAIKQKKDPAGIRAEYERRKGSGKEKLNLVVIGHVDAGKSTMMGHVLYQLGFVNKKTMHKYETEAKKLGKASFAYAWVLDETEEERARGVTMDVAQTRFETPSKMITLLDAPGHKDFIPNMITGAAQADVAILVVNAARGEFETGFEAGGQTREHAMLIRSLGVSQLIVAVNKMDMVDYNHARFDEVTKKLGSFLKTAGFASADVKYVPCSGLTGENLTHETTSEELKRWYTGPCLATLIDQLRAPERQFERPFRQCITDVFKGMGAGISVAGIVQAGCIQPGDKVCIMPQGEIANVKSVLIDEVPQQYAFAGDNPTTVLTNIDPVNLAIGSIVCDPSFPIRVTSRIRARVVIFNLSVPIVKGYQVVFHYQSMSEPAVITKLISQLHKSSGEVIKKKPRCLVKNTSAMIEIDLERPICVELYKDYKELGRFMLRYSSSTIAAGVITEIVDAKQT